MNPNYAKLSICHAQLNGNLRQDRSDEKNNKVKKYLPPFCEGKAIMGFAITEPDAGSDFNNNSSRILDQIFLAS